MTTTLPRRDAVAKEHTWDLESLFRSVEDWEAAFKSVEKKLPALKKYEGTLAQSADVLLKWMRETERIGPRLLQVWAWASLRADQDTANQPNAARNARAHGLFARFMAATSFAQPELLKMKAATLKRFMAEKPALRAYAHYFDNVKRKHAHTRAADVEEVLAHAREPLSAPSSIHNMLADADLGFGKAIDAEGRAHDIGRGTILALESSPDRALRKSAFERFNDSFLGMKNTFAEIFAGKVKTTVFLARARRFPDSLSYSLHDSAIPAEVYHNVIAACNRHVGVWHRFWDIKRRALKLDKLEVCDVFAPLSTPPHVPYAQAVEWICDGMAPLGDDYVRTSRIGLTTQRWVDIYPNQGKRNGAYSGGVYGTHPYILMSYSDSGLSSMSTLAHELGHSMHSHLANETQPFIYSDYSLFVAEVASNFNQAMVRANLLKHDHDKNFQIALIEEAMYNFHRYLFVMPILSQFELWMHTKIEQGGALTADEMIAELARLFKKGYGPAVEVDEQRAGIAWAQFSHFFADFYVYQYASGIAAANALADMVLSEGQPAAARYRNMLKSGGSVYALDALKIAGIDMTTPAPMDRAFKVLEGFVARLESLLNG